MQIKVVTQPKFLENVKENLNCKVVTQQPKYSAAAGLLEIEIAAAFEGWAETNFKVNGIVGNQCHCHCGHCPLNNQCNVMLWKTNCVIVSNQCDVVESHYHCGHPPPYCALHIQCHFICSQ